MDTRQEIREKHIRVGRYLKDIVYAANDGIVTTFAVVAATVGGALSPSVILVVGIANLIADGFSMATGNYLGTKSEKQFYEKEAAEEHDEVRRMPEVERQEIREILAARGYEGSQLEDIVSLISSNEQFWVDFMMHEELKLFVPEKESAFKNGAVTFVSFIVAGSIPLLPYVVLGKNASFWIAVLVVAGALFVIGALRSFFSKASWFFAGVEMLVVGGLAAGMAYGIGFVLRFFVG